MESNHQDKFVKQIVSRYIVRSWNSPFLVSEYLVASLDFQEIGFPYN